MIGPKTSTPGAPRPPLSAEVVRWLGDDRVVVTIVAVVVLTSVFGMFHLTWAVTVGFVGPVLVLAAMVAVIAALIHSTAKVSDIPQFTRLAVAGVAAKVVGTLVRFYVSNTIYDGGDEVVYHEAGAELGLRIHQGIWNLDGTVIEAHSSNTQAIARILGSAYSVVGGSRFLGYVLFSWFSWVGMMLIYRAFRSALPDVDSKPFALLLFFLPSIIYWPSIVGKEAFMMLTMGVAVAGLARFLSGRGILGSSAMVVAGLAGLVWVRPHMALILIAATIPAMLVRAPSRGGQKRQLGRIVMLGVLALALVGVVGNVQAFFGGSGDWYTSGTEQAERQTSNGGSSFEPQPVSSPADLPVAAMNVALRPLPWQANGTTGLIASAESIFLLGLLAWRWRLLLQLPKTIYARPAVAFASAYVIFFIVAFSNVGNAGILARQRTQMLPLALMAMCVAWSDARVAREGARRTGRPLASVRRPPAAAPSAVATPV